MKKLFSMVALVLMGAIMSGCSSDDDNIIDTPQQPKNTGNVVTLTATVGFDDDATTRALVIDNENHKGVKTFAEGDQMAVIYKNTSNETVKAVSAALAAGDITTTNDPETNKKTATFTFTLDDPDKTQNVTYVYPAAMAKADGTINYDALATQNGTLTTLASDLDLAIYTHAWEDGKLPTGTLENQLAILALTLKDGKGTGDKEDDENITSSITSLNIIAGTNSYAVSGYDNSDGRIYVAIRPTYLDYIDVTATDGINNYVKFLGGRTYEAGNGYPVSWLMTIPMFTVGMDGSTPKKVQFAKSNLQATYNGSNWTWHFAEHPWDFIGNAAGNTIIQENGTLNGVGTVDLFGWVGESSEFTGAAEYGISSISGSGYGISGVGHGNSASEHLKHDWGTTIGNGWRTPTKEEWTYVFNHPSSSIVNGTSDACYTHATVAGIPGMILFPDGVTIASNEIAWGDINQNSAWATTCTADQWNAIFAPKNCVFLPAAGYRNGATVLNVPPSYAKNKIGGYYWSSSSSGKLSGDQLSQAYSLYFKSGKLGTAAEDERRYGFTIRLVRDVE